MTVYGIDVGIDIGKSRLAYAWPDYGQRGSIDLASQKMRRSTELQGLQDWLVTKLPSYVQLWIDRPLFHGTGTASGERLTETLSAVLTAQEWDCEPIVVYSQTWKARMVGNHAASKDEIRNWLAEHHRELHDMCCCEDEVDAMVIALYGKGRSEGVIQPPAPKKPKRRKKA